MVLNDGLSSAWAALIYSAFATAIAAGLALKLKGTLLKKFGHGAGTRPETKFPKRWMRVGQVSKLIIYPIKGCAGVQVKQAQVTQLGLRLNDHEFLRDRSFLIVNERGTEQVQDKNPKLALIDVEVSDDGKITLKGPEMEPLTFKGPTNGCEGPEKLCRVGQNPGLKAVDCGDEAAKWLQTYMNNPGVRLVYHNKKESQRSITRRQAQFSRVTTTDLAAFQNYTSYLLIAEESIEELNTHLDQKVSYRNFRPTMLVSNISEPFSEIRWGVVRIGNVLLKGARPCERCKIVTVDPDTGVHSPEGEPLRTLATLPMDFGDEEVEKALKNRPVMGLEMGLLQELLDKDATISVGDPVYVALY